MDRPQTARLIIEINQFDPQVQANDAAVKFWYHSMSPLQFEEAEEAVLQHYRQNPGVKAEPGAILKRALQIRSSRAAGRSAEAVAQAIDAPTPSQQNQADGKLIVSWRQRNPEQWARLMEQGAQERKADLAARGLPTRFPGPPTN